MPFPTNNTDVRETTNPVTYDIVERANWYLTGGDKEVYRQRRYGQFTPGRYATKNTQILVPLMRKIVDFSANRVAGHELILSSPEPAVSDWLEMMARETNIHSTVVKGLRWGSAYGGFYMTPRVDSTGKVALNVIRPDYAYPEWEGSRLKAVCFRTPLGPKDSNDKSLWNLFEYHRMVPMMFDGPNGVEVVLEGDVPAMVSVIDYALYESTERDYSRYGYGESGRSVGIMVPLEEHPDTLHLADEQVNGMVARVVLEGFDRITAEYVPNTAGRFDSLLQNEGDSDFVSVFDLLDLVDHGWTLIGDAMDKGRPRLVVHEDMIDSGNPYRSTDAAGVRTFDEAAGLLIAVSGPPADYGDGTGIGQVKFEMQLNERMAIVNELRLWIIQNTGFSPQSFGLQTENAGDSGLAREYREQATRETVEQKRAQLSEPLRRVISAMAIIDGLPSGDVSVSFPPQNVQSATERADIAVKLYGAGLATVDHALAQLHPGLSEQEVAEMAMEVRRENAERAGGAFEPDGGNNLGERATGEAPGDQPL